MVVRTNRLPQKVKRPELMVSLLVTKKRALKASFSLCETAPSALLAACLATLSASRARFFRCELMGVSALMRGPATFPCNFTLTFRVHGRKATFGFFTLLANGFAVLFDSCHFNISFGGTP
jgi:hypothetical protein